MEHKDKSVYNLAIKRKIHTPPHAQKLPPISQTTDQSPSQLNIFKGQIFEKMENTQQVRPYNLVGKKQFKSYCQKNMKKKQGLRRIDSAISNSKQSNTVRSQDTDHNAYLTKQDLLDTLNKTQKDEFEIKKRYPTLEKAKLRYKKYRNLWQETKKTYKNKMNIYQLVDSNRQKFQCRQIASLKEQKQNIPAEKWKETLRYSFDLSHFYDGSYVENIKKNGIVVRGNSKKSKEVEWISNKTGSVFQFFEKKETRQTMQQRDKNASDTKVKFSFNGRP